MYQLVCAFLLCWSLSVNAVAPLSGSVSLSAPTSTSAPAPLSAPTRLTPFIAEYKIYFGDWHLGKGVYSFDKIDEERYVFSFKSDMTILMFTDHREVKSEFTQLNNRLYPLQYSHDRKGTGADYFDLVVFDKENKIIKSTARGHTVITDYNKTYLDGLSVQFQLMLDVSRRNQVFTYFVFENNAIEEVRFYKIGKETVIIDGVSYDCVQFEAIRRNGQLKTHIWFAQNLNNMPVQMAHYINGSKRFNGKLIRYSSK